MHFEELNVISYDLIIRPKWIQNGIIYVTKAIGGIFFIKHIKIDYITSSKHVCKCREQKNIFYSAHLMLTVRRTAGW